MNPFDCLFILFLAVSGDTRPPKSLFLESATNLEVGLLPFNNQLPDEEEIEGIANEEFFEGAAAELNLDINQMDNEIVAPPPISVNDDASSKDQSASQSALNGFNLPISVTPTPSPPSLPGEEQIEDIGNEELFQAAAAAVAELNQNFIQNFGAEPFHFPRPRGKSMPFPDTHHARFQKIYTDSESDTNQTEAEIPPDLSTSSVNGGRKKRKRKTKRPNNQNRRNQYHHTPQPKEVQQVQKRTRLSSKEPTADGQQQGSFLSLDDNCGNERFLFLVLSLEYQ